MKPLRTALRITLRMTSVATLGLVLGVLAVAPAAAQGDSVYASGLFQLGDGQPPPGMPGVANILENPELAGPDWAGLFNADGSPKDGYGQWVTFAADDVSLGTGFEGSALHPDGRVYNATAAADHDIGNAYAYSTTDSAGNVVLYAGAERQGGGDSSLEFEFNQDHYRLGHGGYGKGIPWEVLGSRQEGDLKVRLSFADGGLSDVEASTWSGGGWVPLSALAGEGCDGAETLCAVCNGSLIEGGPWGSQQIEPGRFWELGVNAGALLGAQPSYVTVRIRTPQDIAFGHFGEGN